MSSPHSWILRFSWIATGSRRFNPQTHLDVAWFYRSDEINLSLDPVSKPGSLDPEPESHWLDPMDPWKRVNGEGSWIVGG